MLIVSGSVGASVAAFSSIVTGSALHPHPAGDDRHPAELTPALRAAADALGSPAGRARLGASTAVDLPADVARNWTAAVVARNGTIVAASKQYLVGAHVTRGFPMLALEGPLDRRARRPRFRSEIARHVLREAPLYDAPGHVFATVMFVPTAAGIADLTRSRVQERLNRLFAMAGLVALALSTLASAVLAARLVKPLRRFVRAAEHMSDGELSTRVPPVQSPRELRALALAFNGMAAKLERTERLRAEMASDVAHELRTPLNNLHGQLEAIEANLMTASPDRIRRLKDETARLGELVADLQQLTLADGDGLHVQPEPVSPAEFLHVLVPKYEGLAAKAGVDIVVDCREDLPLIYADVGCLRKIVVNLIGNAVRHAPPGGHVVVAACSGASQVVLSVSDDGTGIPPEHLDDVFERFFRTDVARSRDDGGSGLGLAIVKKLVEAHGGTIVAENVPGAGARISFTMPLYADGSSG